MAGVLQTLVAASLCWFLASSLWIYPHSLSYFNESIGGPLNGPKHLLGSNVDWGQDLKYFDAWQQRERKGAVGSLHFFGVCADRAKRPKTTKPIPHENGRHETIQVAYHRIEVVSATLLQGLPWVALDRDGVPAHMNSAELKMATETWINRPLTYSLILLIPQ